MYQRKLKKSKFVKVISASDLAKSRFPIDGDRRKAELGKVFEISYSYVSWKIDKCWGLPNDLGLRIDEQKTLKLNRKFDKKEMEDKVFNDEMTHCNNCLECFTTDVILLEIDHDWVCLECALEIFEKIFLEKAKELIPLTQKEEKYLLRLYHLFRIEGVGGRTPKTRARKYNNSTIITAKPDLEYCEHPNTLFNEFKTYPINEYAREQARIFAWVFDSKINLFGVNEIHLKNGDVQYKIQKETIYPPKEIGIIPECIGDIVMDDEICKECNLPNCNCIPTPKSSTS